jgi:hypothetical protein
MVELSAISVGDEFTTVYGAVDSLEMRRTKLDALLNANLTDRNKQRIVKQNTVEYGRNQTYLFDPACNPWAIKFLCSYWGTCAWRRGSDGYIPVVGSGKAYDVWVHVDVATLQGRGKTKVEDWAHGSVTGAHVVVQAYQPVEAVKPQTLKGKPAFALTPDDVYELALLQFEGCYKKHIPGDNCANLLWPESMHKKLREVCQLGA